VELTNKTMVNHNHSCCR